MGVNDDERRELARLLPAYEIAGLIGVGSFGRVYQAWHRHLDRPAAVKALPRTDGPELRRFQEEARIVASLDHLHIVRVYDFVETPDMCLLIMEFLAGGTFAHWRAGGITDELAVASTIHALRGLAHAHALGILHRDVKPENLLFSGPGVLKVSDFGIAKIFGRELAATSTTASQVIGTPAYMAPEQALAGRISPATDVYAMATVLYEALAGDLPFTSDRGAVNLLLARATQDPLPLMERRRDAPAATAEVLMQALQRDPLLRTPDAETLALGLDEAGTRDFGPRWLERHGTALKPPTSEPRPRRTPRAETGETITPLDEAAEPPRTRRRWAVMARVGGAVVLLIGSAVYVTWRQESHSSLQPVAPLRAPTTVAVAITGTTYIGDSLHRVVAMDPDGRLRLVAGTTGGKDTGNSDRAVDAHIGVPSGLAVDRRGDVFISDAAGSRVNKVTANGSITTVAGNGRSGFGGDGGRAVDAELHNPYGLAVDDKGDLFIADGTNNRIRKVSSSGSISTVAGTGGHGDTGDGGPAVDAEIGLPDGLTVDSSGHLFILDVFNNVVREVAPDGKISTLAGQLQRGFAGDGGPAVAAVLNLSVTYPATQGLAADGHGNVFIADGDNHRVRQVLPDGTITTVAGNGRFGGAGDGGPATHAELQEPLGVAIRGGDLLLADYTSNKIRQISSNGVITTLVTH